jgi:y4mF family transcriptional regulator
MPTTLTIGAFVRERRKANRMTQQQLAELAGVGKRFVSEIERGKNTVRVDAANRVLAVFGKTLGVVDLPPENTS